MKGTMSIGHFGSTLEKLGRGWHSLLSARPSGFTAGSTATQIDKVFEFARDMNNRIDDERELKSTKNMMRSWNQG